MKILYIAHRIPYPPNKGDKIRSFNEIKYLCQRHEIHLACLADDPKDLKHKEDLKGFCKSTNVVLINPRLAKLKSSFYLFSKTPLSVPYFYSKKLQQTIDQLLLTVDFDVIFCFSSPMAEYVFRSKLLVSSCLKLEKSDVKGLPVTGDRKLAPSVQQPLIITQQVATSKKYPATSAQHPATRIMDFVDVDSDKWVQYSKYARFPMSWIYALEGRRLASYERKVAENFDHSIFVAEAEGKIFGGKHPHLRNVSVIPNGVDLDYFSPKFSQGQSAFDQHLETSNEQRATINHQLSTGIQLQETSNQQPVVVFTGAMDYFANVDGVVWFTKEILPLIKQEIPEIRFYIVGSNPTKEVLSLASDGRVTVTGFVPDTREYLSRATVVVVPLRIARGIQNKILEAMAMAIPVVATPQAFEGIEAQPSRDLILGENAEKIAAGVVQLMKKVDLRRSLGDNARRIIEENYCWAKNLSRFDSILTK